MLWTGLRQPIVDEVSESVEQEVLEQHTHDQYLIIHVAIRVKCIGLCCYNKGHNAENYDTMESGGYVGTS